MSDTLCRKQSYHSFIICCAVICALVLGLFTAFRMLDVLAEDKEAEEEIKLSVDFTKGGNGYSAVLYNNENGLPTSEANAIAQTSEGFIWIGSYSGLIRYDGNTFERMDSTTGIASVVSLHVDQQDRLWVGTNDSGVAMINKNEVLMFDKSDGLKSSSVRAIEEDDAGLIYIATAKGIAVIDHAMTLQVILDERVSEQYIRCIKAGPNNVIYGVTQDGAVFTMQNGEVTSFYDAKALGISEVISAEPDMEHEGFLYLGTEDSIVYRGRLGERFPNRTEIDVSPLRYVNSITCINEQIWVTSDNGIGYQENGEMHVLDSIPLNNSIEHFLVDYSGNLWFTSSRQGVMKIVPNQFTNIFERFDLPDMVVNSTCMYGERLFVGTDRGLTVLSGQEVLAELPLRSCVSASGKELAGSDLLQMLDGVRIRAIRKDQKNRMWFSTYSEFGLICYDGEGAVCYLQADGMPSERVRTTCECTDGTILAPCSGGGVAVIINGKVTDVYDEEDGLGNADILTAEEANNGDILFGSDGDGLFVLSNSGLKHLGTEDGLSSDVIMRIKKDRKRDIFWIVTSNSLAWMDSDYKIRTVNRFPYSNNFDLYENSREDLWILSSNGIYVTTADELMANEEALSPVFYGKDNGLPCITTANSYSELTEDGNLYIAGTTGVASVNIEETFESISDVKMAVPYVGVDGKYVFPNKNGVFEIPSDVKKLTIYPYVYTYSLMNPKVTYSLEGFEEDPVTVLRSNLGPVDYTNLSGGQYRYVMTLKDTMGSGSKTMSVEIVKTKAIHELTWFRVLVILGIAAVIAAIALLYSGYKTRVLEKKAEENRIFIREMTEAIANTIDMKDTYTKGHSNRVAKYTRLLAEELGLGKEEAEKYYNIALLHDIGKIGVPAEVLNKPGKLTDDEFNIIKSHSMLGYRALKNISIMPELAIGAGSHHERPDGKGYPQGLKGEEIPRVAKIIAVADTFDAMYSDRPYRKRMNFDKAVSIIREVSGTQLDPEVVNAFLSLVDKGLLKAEDDTGGGSMEDIDNIHKKFEKQETDKTKQ